MLLSREIDIKLRRNYTQTYTCKRTSSNGIAVYWSPGHMIQTKTRVNNTALPLVGVLVRFSGRINNIVNCIYSK